MSIAPGQRVSKTASSEFILTRVFDAPRAVVFKAWTEIDKLTQWWGPKGMTMKVSTLDLKPMGLFHYSMTTPDGKEMWGKFVYREITPPERLCFISSFSNAEAGKTRHPASQTWPLEVMSTVIFEEVEGKKTKVTLKGVPIKASEVELKTFSDGYDSMKTGFTGTFDQLEEYLSKK
ncbi:MAG: SRPBCC domain-containing protein [Candidatus Obscuribacterales bacterium]|nr:SRPBCC domain-containing protein [Candidatus Obscuribacterales bacterium]